MAVRPETLRWVKEQAALEAARAVSAQAPKPVSRVLNMSERAEEAATRFMNDGWLDRLRYSYFSPGDMWTIAWCAIGTAHLRLSSFVLPSHYRTGLEPPCSMGAILEFAALPALTEEEAEHRADRFCSRVLDRARQLYRDGYFADPFTPEPLKRASLGGTAIEADPLAPATHIN